jgi:exopolysaccharide biosynthesis polyprenyl glycosylphosphotransferase
MAVTLALLEGSSLFAGAFAAICLWARPLLSDRADVALVLGQALPLSLCCLVAFYYNDLYDLRIVRSFGDFAARLLQSFGIACIMMAALYTAFPETKIAGGPFVSSLLIVAALLLPLRAVSYGVIRSRPFVERVLILGTGPVAHKLIEEIDAQPHFGYVIVGVVDDASASHAAPWQYPLRGPLEHLGKIIEETHPHRIFVALAERRGRLPVDQLLESRVAGITVEDGVKVYERLTGKIAIESLTPSDLIFSKDFLKSRLDLALGRAMSLVLAVIGIVILTPLLLLIALAIKLDSGGPVFFVQDRVSLYGKPFRLIKFRTMRPVTGETSKWVRDNHTRITRVGKWLRKFRLDELPQVVNMLQGDMNLVGPRPHPVSNFELFIDKIPYYALRAVVRPGVTGWAQVRYGYANDLQEETEKMRYDLFYIKHLSLWLDLRILFDTLKIVLFGREVR